MRQHCTVILYFAIAFAGLFATHPLQAQNLTVLRKFKGPTYGDGFLPLGVVLDGKGNLFGTTGQGGTFNFGTIFKLDSHGHYSRVHSFSNTATDGGAPNGGLVVVNGNLFGTTLGGGTNNAGTVFKLNAQGVETVLYNFMGGKDGANPSGSLIRDTNGNLYGETQFGGDISGSCFIQGGCGTIFKIDAKTGKKTTFPLPSTFTVGALPFAGLALDSVGNLYGAAERGGDKTCGFGSPKSGCGTVVKLDTAGKFTVLHTFKDGTDGGFPTFLTRTTRPAIFSELRLMAALLTSANCSRSTPTANSPCCTASRGLTASSREA